MPEHHFHSHSLENRPGNSVVPNWKPPGFQTEICLEGRFTRIERLDPLRHLDSLWDANSLDVKGHLWDWLPYGPFKQREEYRNWMESVSRSSDPLLFTIVDQKSQRALGTAAYLRFYLSNGNVEVGHLCFSPLLQNTPAGTEAMVLMMSHVFGLGFRRVEWKCNALNIPSRNAARRLGFSFEGLFRQAAVVKGRNRDTAWYSVLDREWPTLRKAFMEWLDRENFDPAGRQKTRLSEKIDPTGKRESRQIIIEGQIEKLFEEQDRLPGGSDLFLPHSR